MYLVRKCVYNAYFNDVMIMNNLFYLVNCLDRHESTNPHGIALIWEKNDPNTENEKVTYRYTCGLSVY